jgi:peptidyl-prolyl cis-trans isomerase B (cyclophilin B)
VVAKDQRRRQLARDKFQRQQERRNEARKKARRRNSVIAAVVAVVVAAGVTVWTTGLGGAQSTNVAATAIPSASATGKAPDPCQQAAPGTAGTLQWKTQPALTINKSAKYTFTLDTTCGTIPIALDAAKAPYTVNSFKFLADKGFFNHTKCHRLVTSGIYVLQCGDPTSTGSGGPGYTIPDENLNALGKAGTNGSVIYPAGTIAMANTGSKNTGGSQFFLVYKDSPLTPTYTPFGTISASGMKVLLKIAAAGAQPANATTGNTPPNATVVINKATVTQS